MGIAKKEHKKYPKKPLFQLDDGSDVFYGDPLWHPDTHRVGWVCFAEFTPDGGENGRTVTVRSANGAVPTVDISDLKRKPPVYPPRCPTCGRYEK